MSNQEDDVARLCIAVDTATCDVELYVANAAPIEDTALRNASNTLECACASLLATSTPDVRLARRVSRLGGLLLDANLPHAFRALCAYGALGPPHHADRLATLFTTRPDAIEHALPAILALPPPYLSLTAHVVTCARTTSVAGDGDAAALAASALSALVDAGARPPLEIVREAGIAARSAGLDEARRELAHVLGRLRQSG